MTYKHFEFALQFVVAFIAFAATASAGHLGLGWTGLDHADIGLGHNSVAVNHAALSPIGPSGVVTGHGAVGPSGVVTGTVAIGPSGIVNGRGGIGPTLPNEDPLEIIAAAIGRQSLAWRQGAGWGLGADRRQGAWY